MRENLDDPGGFGHSIDAAKEETSDHYAMRTKIDTLRIGSEERLPQLLSNLKGPDFRNVITIYDSMQFEKEVDICWMCSSLFKEASEATFHELS